MYKIIRTLIFFLSFFSAGKIWGQCPAGQTNVVVIIQPDNLGAETTWELKNSATQAVINHGGPYPSGNTTPDTISNCVDDGTNVTFVIHDSYGDGMCCLQGNGFYNISIGANQIAHNGTFSFIDSVSFLAPPVSLDASVISVTLPQYVDTTSHVISGTLANKGLNTITSVTMSFQIDNGSIVTQVLSGLNIPKFTNHNFSFVSPNKWHPSVTGAYQLKVWASLINGSSDQNTANDVYTENVYVAERLPLRHVLLESFTSSSDTIGLLQDQVLDSMIADNSSKVVALKYHLGIPAPFNDPMYLQNTLEPDARKLYYAVGSVPHVVMNGKAFSGLPSNLSQASLDAEYAKPGLLDFYLDESKNGNDISIQVKTIALVPLLSSDLRLFVVLNENPVHFSSPPFPSTKNDFNFVMRKMVTGTSGTTLGSLSPGQEDSVTLNYTVDPSVVDTSKLRTLVFVQDNNTKEIVQALAGKSHTGSNHQTTIVLGMDQRLSPPEGFSVLVFPNPASEQVSVAFTPEKSGETNFRLYTLLGEQVYAKSIFAIEQESYVLEIPTNFLPAGMYILSIANSRTVINKKVILK